MKHAVFTLALLAAATAAAQTPPPPDPNRMSRSALAAEVTAQRPLIQNGGVQPSRVPGCTGPEHRQLDFWLGEWDVSPTGSDMVVAESSIRSLDQGCTIFEEWRPFQGPGGHSLSDYDPADQGWHQTWIEADARRTLYDGHLEGDVMRLANSSQTDKRRRMSYQRIDADTVRQWGEQFNETTQAWDITWDFTYKRRPGTRP